MQEFNIYIEFNKMLSRLLLQIIKRTKGGDLENCMMQRDSRMQGGCGYLDDSEVISIFRFMSFKLDFAQLSACCFRCST